MIAPFAIPLDAAPSLGESLPWARGCGAREAVNVQEPPFDKAAPFNAIGSGELRLSTALNHKDTINDARLSRGARALLRPCASFLMGQQPQ